MQCTDCGDVCDFVILIEKKQQPLKELSPIDLVARCWQCPECGERFWSIKELLRIDKIFLRQCLKHFQDKPMSLRAYELIRDTVDLDDPQPQGIDTVPEQDKHSLLFEVELFLTAPGAD